MDLQAKHLQCNAENKQDFVFSFVPKRQNKHFLQICGSEIPEKSRSLLYKKAKRL